VAAATAFAQGEAAINALRALVAGGRPASAMAAANLEELQQAAAGR
jgi:hypothetical protein